MFWLKSEPIFKKTPTLNFNCPPPAAAGKETRLARGQKILRRHGGKKIFCPLALSIYKNRS